MEFKNLKSGEILSETQFYTVVKKKGDKVQLKNDEGVDIVVNKGYVEKALTSAEQFEETKQITRTELSHLVLNSPRIAMTVNFNKKLNEADVKKALYAIHGKYKNEKDFQKRVREALNLKGEERTMKGRHYGRLDQSTGRLQFIDMTLGTKKVDSNNDVRNRQVDPRTLNWAIIDGVKYQVK